MSGYTADMSKVTNYIFIHPATNPYIYLIHYYYYWSHCLFFCTSYKYSYWWYYDVELFKGFV